MRMTDLLGSEVLGSDDVSIGKVHDVRVVQAGAPVGVWGASLQVRSLLVGPRSLGVRLGFDRAGVRGPWPLKAGFMALHRGMVEISWGHVTAIEPTRLRIDATADRSADLLPDEPPAGRVLDVGLSLLDLQLIDPNGRMAGKVDDLELAFEAGGGPPAITAILAGPGALARRIGGRLGGWIARAHERLQDRHVEGPARISFGVVERIDRSVRLMVSRRDLPTDAMETWMREHLIAKIPGAGGSPAGGTSAGGSPAGGSSR